MCLRAGDRQKYKIPLEYLRWYAAFHRKEDGVISTLLVFSSDPKGYLTKQGIRQVKSPSAADLPTGSAPRLNRRLRYQIP